MDDMDDIDTHATLKAAVDTVISYSDEPETAHVMEDRLLRALINLYAPTWVKEEVLRLSEADFPRWCA